MSVKTAIYAAAKTARLFDASRWLTRNGLRILCYHGFAFTDEYDFRPLLFQTPSFFRKRLAFLKQQGYRTLTLSEADDKLQRGTLTSRDIVITIDDGLHGVYALAAPILREFGFTATVYVTTYYVVHNNPVFRLALQYLFWRTQRSEFRLGTAVLPPGSHPTKGSDSEPFIDALIAHGENAMTESERQALLATLAQALDVDFGELVASRRLTLMNKTEIAELAAMGLEVQLHTHRHQLPENDALIRRELDDNRAILSELTSKPLDHFCYPSGIWSEKCWPALTQGGVRTATTCDAGLNYADAKPLAWSRFLDFQSTPQIVFEADVSGFSEMPRWLRKQYRQLRGGNALAPSPNRDAH